MGLVLRAAVLINFATATIAGIVSNDALQTTTMPHGATGRSLLQLKKNCPVNLETANYTEVTSRCKGPVYNESLCCAAFSDFACSNGAYINDLTTNCAATMLSYLRLYGSYPPGLFANTCKQDLKNGLRCLGWEETSAAATTASPAWALVAAAFAAVFYVYYILIMS